MSEVALIAGLLLLTFASGFFSSSEVALFSLSSMQVQAFRNSGNPRRRLVAALFSRPRDLLVTVFMLNTLVNILLQNVASDLFGAFAGWELKVGVPLAITLIFGEIIPKNIGIHYNNKLSSIVAPVIDICQRVSGPLRRWIIKITSPVSRLLFFYLRKSKKISQKELHHALATSAQHGILNKDEATLVRGYLNMQHATVREVMRPKEEILYYSANEPLSKLTYLLVEMRCSRVPVSEGSLQNVLGVISAKNFFIHRDYIQKGADLLPFLEKPFFVPQTIPVKTVLRKFAENSEEFGLVVNEYGSISGLITDEDIAELVVGEISDVRDEGTLYTMAGKGELIADGKFELNELAKILGDQLPTKANVVTIGGWLMEQLGTIPKAGTTYESHGYVFQILTADPNRVKRVYIRKLQRGQP